MKICPYCKREIEDDSAFCGYCDKKQPYVPEETGGEEEAAGEETAAVPAGWRCGNCGEQLEDNFDTCWKCGAVKESAADGQAGAAEGDADGPLLTVWGAGRRLEVSRDRVLITPEVSAGGAAYSSPCEILIKNIVSIEFTNATAAAMGRMDVNYSAAPADDPANAVSMDESVLFGAEANKDMAKALELIKERRAALDTEDGDAGR